MNTTKPDPYASEAETRALLVPDTRTAAEKHIDGLLESLGANEQGVEPEGRFNILRQIAVALAEAESQPAPVQDPEQWAMNFIEEMLQHTPAHSLLASQVFHELQRQLNERYTTPLAAQPAPVPDETLLSFYQATDFPSLVAAMEGHIKKMQGKLQANPHTAIDAWNNREMHRTSPAQPAMPLTDDARGFLVIEHLGPNALLHKPMSIYDAFHMGIDAAEAAHGITTATQQGSAASRTCTCTWTPSGDPNMPGTWAGSCGAMWTFTEDGPVENGVHYCHKCGGALIIEEATHADA